MFRAQYSVLNFLTTQRIRGRTKNKMATANANAIAIAIAIANAVLPSTPAELIR